MRTIFAERFARSVLNYAGSHSHVAFLPSSQAIGDSEGKKREFIHTNRQESDQ